MISHRHRFIFVHVAKTGGTSIEAAFGIGPDYVNPEEPRDRRHFGLSDYKALFPAEYASYFKFALVRNPWDRAVSWWAHRRDQYEAKFAGMRRELVSAEADAGGKLERKIARLDAKVERHPAFQSFEAFLEDPGDFPLMQLADLITGVDMDAEFNFVGRFERLEDHFGHVCHLQRLWAALPHVNRSRRTEYTAYYLGNSARRIANLCAHDIERFGYRFGD